MPWVATATAHALLRIKQVLRWLEGHHILTSLSSWARSLSLDHFTSKRVKDRQQLEDVGSNARTAETLSPAAPNGTTLVFFSQSNSG